ncbi:MAG: nuclear transport factor 2 family protein [Actinomycetota bacterium]|nr:nuclear transport factor 2 family protein [Actinomycetota bacterium]
MAAVIDRLVQAVNNHDLEGLVSCFANDYVNETPVHPHRGFTGRDQVRTNWTQIFAGVPDIEAAVLRRAESDDRIWTEWEMSGTRSEDGGPFLMRGVVILGTRGDVISSARFYLEPAEEASGDVDAHTRRLVTGKEPS